MPLDGPNAGFSKTDEAALIRLSKAMDRQAHYFARGPTDLAVLEADGTPFAHLTTTGRHGAIIAETYVQRHQCGWAVLNAMQTPWEVLGFSNVAPCYAIYEALEKET